MKTYMEQRDELIKAARDIAEKAQTEGRELSIDEANEINAKGADVAELSLKIKAADSAAELLASLGEARTVKQRDIESKAFGSLGEYAVDGLKDSFSRIRGRRRVQADVAEFKAAGDTHTVTTTGDGILQPQIDRNVVHLDVQRPTIAAWLGKGTLDSTAITYFVEKAYSAVANGAFTEVLEDARKPGITFPDYDSVTETLHKIAGWIKLSDEMAEDTPFLVSEINNRLLYQLVMFEENSLLNGTGASNTITGILNRVGLLTETSTAKVDNLEAIFRGIMKVLNTTGLAVDGIVINPVDYQALRLAKDGNGQYLAGGPFFGQYGGGAMSNTPPLWGVENIIVTTAIAAGTVLVGAGEASATVYRKGGIRVEASNVDGEDFTHNRFTVLAEERIALAVRKPSGFAKVTLSSL